MSTSIHTHLAPGAIAGIVVGAVIGSLCLVGIGLLLGLYMRRHKNLVQRRETQETIEENETPAVHDETTD